VNLPALLAAYTDRHPDPGVAAERVAFGTSGHRGSSLKTTFNDDHIAATSQAICEYRAAQGTDGPLFIGRDTHALSEPSWVTAIEVFQANGVHVLADGDDAYTPTPAVSHAILTHNRARVSGLADGVVVTPSHNPPARRRVQVQPAERRPADTDATKWIARGRTSCSPRSWTGCGAGRSTASDWQSTTSSAVTSTTCPRW
jgi:phosphoglucomutase